MRTDGFRAVVGMDKGDVDELVTLVKAQGGFKRGPAGKSTLNDHIVMFLARFGGGASAKKVRGRPIFSIRSPWRADCRQR